MVGVLVFVDQYVMEFLLVFLANFRVVLEQVHGQQQQVVKVHSVALLHALHIQPVDFCQLFLVVILGSAFHLVRSHMGVFGVGNGRKHRRQG